MSDYNEHLISMAGGDGDVLDQIQRRADKATDGPWESGTLGGHAADVFTIDADDDLGRLVICEHAGTDAEFIAHARTDIPALLTLVREQQSAIDRVLELANWAGKHGWTLDAAAIRVALEPTK